MKKNKNVVGRSKGEKAFLSAEAFSALLILIFSVIAEIHGKTGVFYIGLGFALIVFSLFISEYIASISKEDTVSTTRQLTYTRYRVINKLLNAKPVLFGFGIVFSVLGIILLMYRR